MQNGLAVALPEPDGQHPAIAASPPPALAAPPWPVPPLAQGVHHGFAPRHQIRFAAPADAAPWRPCNRTGAKLAAVGAAVVTGALAAAGSYLVTSFVAPQATDAGQGISETARACISLAGGLVGVGMTCCALVLRHACAPPEGHQSTACCLPDCLA